MMDEAVKELINAIKDMSPVVWEAALVRVQVNGWLDLVIAGIAFMGIMVLAGLARNFAKEAKAKDDSDIGGIAIACILGAAILFIPFLGNLYYGLLLLLSPEWSAIQLILEQVK